MKRIIILEDTDPSPRTAWRVVYWAEVPEDHRRFYADPARVSAYLDATPEELQALREGSVTERVDLVSLQPKQDGTKEAEAFVREQMQAGHAIFQRQVNERQDWRIYGTSWDGKDWTDAGIKVAAISELKG